MIAFIKGVIAAIADDNVVIDTGAFGLNVKISTQTANLLPGIGQEIKLYTYTHVREDAFLLFGFFTGDDLEIFKKLITVSGIGPKGGLAVLSVMNADELRFAILAGDSKAITKAPGIGGKTAERIILELRDKVSTELLPKEPHFGAVSPAGLGQGGGTGADNIARHEAAEALVALGYSAAEALKAVRKAALTEDMEAEAILKAALKNMF